MAAEGQALEQILGPGVREQSWDGMSQKKEGTLGPRENQCSKGPDQRTGWMVGTGDGASRV